MDDVLSKLTGLFGKINENTVNKKRERREGLFFFFFCLQLDFLSKDYVYTVSRGWLMNLM